MNWSYFLRHIYYLLLSSWVEAVVEVVLEWPPEVTVGGFEFPAKFVLFPPGSWLLSLLSSWGSLPRGGGVGVFSGLGGRRLTSEAAASSSLASELEHEVVLALCNFILLLCSSRRMTTAPALVWGKLSTGSMQKKNYNIIFFLVKTHTHKKIHICFEKK